MRGQERIPLHDHVDSNSGGPINGGVIFEAVGGGGGTSGGGTTVHAVEGALHNTAETDTAKVLHPDGLGGVAWGSAVSEGVAHYEVLMDGSSPPAPLEDGSGFDWLYVWVP
jgi:hypothetical protein